MKCLQRHSWEECDCSSQEVEQYLLDKAWMTGVFCCLVAAMLWVAFG